MAIRTASRSTSPGAARLLGGTALGFALWLAAVHLAVPAENPPGAPGLAGDAAPPAPACVGCHHGGGDEEPPPDGGLSGPERTALMGFRAVAGTIMEVAR